MGYGSLCAEDKDNSEQIYGNTQKSIGRKIVARVLTTSAVDYIASPGLMSSSTAAQLSGLQHVIETKTDSPCAALHVHGSTVQALVNHNDRVLYEARLDDATRPWALLAVVEEAADTRAAYFIRTLLADTVQKVLNVYKPPFQTSRGYVSPLSAALLRLASKFSKICLSETVLGTNCTIAVFDVKLETVYTVVCGSDTQLPVVTDHSGDSLQEIHKEQRNLAGVRMAEATYSAPVGQQFRIILGNSGLWQFVHPHKAGLHAAAYAKAEDLSTEEHHHDSATAVLRAALRTIVDRCAASSSARTAVLNTLSQLDRLSPGSKREAQKSSGSSGMVPRMRGDIHPNLTAAVMNIDTTMQCSLASVATASDAIAPGTPGSASSLMSEPSQLASSPQKDRNELQWQGMSRDPTRTQSQPDMATYLLQSRRSSRRELPMKGSPLARQSPLSGQPVGPDPAIAMASSRHSSPYTSQRTSAAPEAPAPRSSLSPSSSVVAPTAPASPGQVPLARQRASGDSLAAAAAASGSTVSRPAAVHAGWLCTTNTAFNSTSRAASMDGGSTPARSPSRTSLHGVPLPPTRLSTLLINAQGTEGRAAALSLPHSYASGSATDFQAMRAQGSDAGGVGRCISVGDFEYAGVQCEDGIGVREAERATASPGWEHTDVSRRWRLMQQHVKVLGLERKLRRDMWKDVLDAAMSQSASSSEHGAASPQQEAAQEALDRNLLFESQHAGFTQSTEETKRGTASPDARDTEDSSRNQNLFTPERSSPATAASPKTTTPRCHKKWFGRS